VGGVFDIGVCIGVVNVREVLMDALLRRMREIESARRVALVLMSRYSTRYVRNGGGRITMADLGVAARVKEYWDKRWERG